MPMGMLRRIPPDSVAPLRAAGAAGSPVNRHLLHGRGPVDVVLPAGALTDQAHQAHPMPGFTLYEPIRGHILGIGERGIRSTVSRAQLEEALQGYFTSNHSFLLTEDFTQMDDLGDAIDRVSAVILGGHVPGP